jgi:hypothetical protein
MRSLVHLVNSRKEGEFILRRISLDCWISIVEINTFNLPGVNLYLEVMDLIETHSDKLFLFTPSGKSMPGYYVGFVFEEDGTWT